MSFSLQPLFQLQQDLSAEDPASLEKWHAIPSVETHIFNSEETPLERVALAIQNLKILKDLREVKVALSELDPERAKSLFERVSSNDSRVAEIVYRKMEELLGNQGIPNLGSKVFLSPTVVPVIKFLALQPAIERLENHWSFTLLKDVEGVSSGKSEESWKKGYAELLEGIRKRNLSPLEEENPNVMNKVVADFMEVFDQAPSEERQGLLKTSLFPNDEHPEWAKPLNYVMFTGNYEALVKIEPYLKEEDWKALGPYDSTFCHCIISGMEKNASSGNDPVRCMEMLLTTAHELKSQDNAFGFSPLKYLETVLPKLRENHRFIEDRSVGGFSGLNPSITSQDGVGGYYNETSSQYSSLMRFAKRIRELLQS